jgi:hypothetical protein
MIRRITLLLLATAILLSSAELHANQQIWQDVSLQARGLESGIRHFSVDQTALRNQLDLVPHETMGDRSRSIKLPMPDGSLASFVIVESPVMKPALAARYPEIKTFKVFGIDDSLASGRVDITPQGFHAMLFTAKGRLFIDPDLTSTQSGQYLSRYRSGQPTQEFSCGMYTPDFEDNMDPIVAARSAARTPGALLQYDLAVAATKEYVAALGGTVALAQAGIVTAINRVNGIYERDLGIRLQLVDTNDELIENGDNVSFSNGNVFAMLDENQVWLDKKLTSLGYDIGHVFGTGDGGAAFLGAACNNLIKAKGVTGQNDELEDDSFYIDYVAHEIGHQFNAEHSFNGTTLACGNGRNQATAFEPGSGSTIMAYAGICGGENLQINSDVTFHAGSIVQIDSFTRGAENCADSVSVPSATIPKEDNSDPNITSIVIANKTIPIGTPFVLDGTAFDMDMDELSYQWDQMDAGCPTNSASFGTDNGSNALFRSYVPRKDPWRNFPAMVTQVRGRFDKAEVMPCQDRDLNFRLTARDGNSGRAVEDVLVSVDKSAGPFKITYIDPGPIFAGTAFKLIWDVAYTNLPPIDCRNVDFDLISFSDDPLTYLPDPLNPLKYSIHPLVAASDLNDGSEFVTFNPGPAIAIPETATHPRSRVRVKCSDNIFYDLSDANLTVEATIFPAVKLSDTDIEAYYFQNKSITDTVASACGAVVDCTPPPPPPPPVDSGGSKGGGSGTFDYLWLLMMTGLIGFIKLYRRYGLQ